MNKLHLIYLIPLIFASGMLFYATIDEDFNEDSYYSFVRVGIMLGCETATNNTISTIECIQEADYQFSKGETK